MLLEAIILGLVQGLTEFLPDLLERAPAHRRRVPARARRTRAPPSPRSRRSAPRRRSSCSSGATSSRIITQWFQALVGRIPRNDPDARMGWLIIIGSIPIVVLGLLFQDQIETTFRSLWLDRGHAHRLRHPARHRRLRRREEAPARRTSPIPHGIIYGFAQALALIPGVSRSGGTITAGLFMGYERAAAARYAFLLAIPAVFGSGFYQLSKSWDEPAACFTLARDGGRHRRRVRRRARRDRVLHELHLQAQLPAVRDLPHRARRRCCSCCSRSAFSSQLSARDRCRP